MIVNRIPRSVLLLLLLLVTKVWAYSQSDRYFGRMRIPLAQSLNADKVVVLTQDMATFYFSFYRYKAYFLKDMDENSDLMRGIEIMNEMEEQMKNDTLYFNSFSKKPRISGITHNFLYRSIKSRNLMVFNHNTQAYARKLIRKRFISDCGYPRCGSGGFRYFFTKDTFIVFEWIKWIS